MLKYLFKLYANKSEGNSAVVLYAEYDFPRHVWHPLSLFNLIGNRFYFLGLYRRAHRKALACYLIFPSLSNTSGILQTTEPSISSLSDSKIPVGLGSKSHSRAVRAGPAIVDFVHSVLLTSPATPRPEISIIDITSFNLPAFNEPVMLAMVPLHAQFEYEHSKVWPAAMKPFNSTSLWRLNTTMGFLAE